MTQTNQSDSRQLSLTVTEDAASKQCKLCATTKPRTEFGIQNNAQSGLQSYCNDCRETIRRINRLYANQGGCCLKRVEGLPVILPRGIAARYDAKHTVTVEALEEIITEIQVRDFTLDEAVSTLKEAGYKIMKPVTNYEEI